MQSCPTRRVGLWTILILHSWRVTRLILTHHLASQTTWLSSSSSYQNINGIVQEDVVAIEVRFWTALSETTLQDIDWNMFQSSSYNISEFTEVVRSFTAAMVNDIIPECMAISKLVTCYHRRGGIQGRRRSTG